MRRLLIRPGGIGDFILSLPAMECLKTDYLEVWASRQNLSLARFADRTRAIPSTGLDLLGVTDPSKALLEDLKGFDSVVSWYGANRPEFRDLIEKLGLRFEFLTALPPGGSSRHAADFYLDQVRTLHSCELGACESDGVPRIACAEAPGGFAIIHPFSGSRKKNWPMEKFRELASILTETMPVHWCAGPDDPPLEGAVRIDDLWELARWLARARVYFGNDCGITHLAAAVGTPVVALFGPTDPAVWGPRGPNVRIQRFTPGERFDI